MKIQLLVIVPLLFYLFSENAAANTPYQQKIDSLTSVLNKSKDLNKQAELHNQLSELEFNRGELKTALTYAWEANKIAKSVKNDHEIGVSYIGIAQYYSYSNNYTESIKYYEKALTHFKKINHLWRIAFSSFYLGEQFSFLSIHDKALQSYYTSLEYYQKNNQPEGIIMAYIKIGLIYSVTDESEKAPGYFNRAIQLCEETNDEHNKIHALQSLGLHYYKTGQLDLALKYLYKQADLAKKKKEYDHDLASAYIYIGEIKTKQNKLDEALFFLKNSEKVYEEMGSVKGKLGSIRRLSVVYYEQKKYDLAKELIQTSIDYHLKTKEKNPLYDDYRILSLINEGMGEYKSALEHYKLFKSYQDSLKLDDASKTAMKYEFGKKEAELKAKQAAEIAHKNVVANTTYGVMGSVLLFSTLGLYTYWIRNKKLRLEKQNLELKRREAELAKDTEAFKSRFLSNISHEFRTPLTLINGHLEILKREGDAENINRFNEMEYSGKRLLQLINQLLDLTQIENKKYSLYYKKGKLLNEVQNYVQAFHSLAEQRKINLSIDITDATKEKFKQPDFAYSSEALASIMNNLISNALKYTPEGGTVKTILDFKDETLYISVQDSGCGIPEKDIPHIFDRFYQVKNDRQPIYEGSGIGLAIVKELSQYHGGDAIVENNITTGCTFKVWIKEGNETDEIDDSVLSTIHPSADELNKEEEMKIYSPDQTLILIVEDQKELRKFIVENLGIEYQFLEAESGKQGIELALEHMPDLIISDVMMPELSGFDLTKQLKENQITSHIPILLLTAKVDQNDKIEGLEYGADDYLTKPFSISELQLRVKNRLRQQENLRRRFSENPIPTIEEDTVELNTIDRKFIDKLNTIVTENIENELDVSFLASEIGLSTSQLNRKLKVLIGVTPANFIKNIQLNYALELLKEGYSVSEACWKSGFTDPAYFSKIFKRHFGFLPSDKAHF